MEHICTLVLPIRIENECMAANLAFLRIPIIQERPDVQLSLQFLCPLMSSMVGSERAISHLIETEVLDHTPNNPRFVRFCTIGNTIMRVDGSSHVSQQLVHVVDQVILSVFKGFQDGLFARKGTQSRPVIVSAQHIGMLRRRGRYITFLRLIRGNSSFSMRRRLCRIYATQCRHEFAYGRSATARQCILSIDDRALGIVHRSARQGAVLIPFRSQVFTDDGDGSRDGGTRLGTGEFRPLRTRFGRRNLRRPDECLHAVHPPLDVGGHAFDLEFVAVGNGKDGRHVVVTGDNDEAAAVAGHDIKRRLHRRLGGHFFPVPDDAQCPAARFGRGLRGEDLFRYVECPARRDGRRLQRHRAEDKQEDGENAFHKPDYFTSM